MARSWICNGMIVLFTLCTPNISQKYIFVAQIKTINEAETYCRVTYGTTLASIHNVEDNDEAYRVCSSHSKCVHGPKCQAACSIGAKYEHDDAWTWSDQSEFNYWNWDSVQGDPSEITDCAVIWANNHDFYSYRGTWNHCSCDGADNSEQYFLCNALTNINIPTPTPTDDPTINPTTMPTNVPTMNPTKIPSSFSTKAPTRTPTYIPTNIQSTLPTNSPINNPTSTPTHVPTDFPSKIPSNIPTRNPTLIPTLAPTLIPSSNPTLIPTLIPITNPTNIPTSNPTLNPTLIPTSNPSNAASTATIQNEAIVLDVADDSSDSIQMTLIYLVGGVCGALVFALICICVPLVSCFICFWKRKQERNLDEKDDPCEDGMRPGNNAHEKHYYHHSVQLTESVFNTIQIDMDEGDEPPYPSATVSNNEKDDLLAFMDESEDDDLDEMYEQSRDSTREQTKRTANSKGDYDNIRTKIKIDRCATQNNIGFLDVDTDDESDSMLLDNMYLQPMHSHRPTKKLDLSL